MSIVDNWDWDKLDLSGYDKEFKMTADMKVRSALLEFYELYNIWPNKIIMGHHLENDLYKEFISTVRSFEEIMAINNGDMKCEYEGIPVDIDYNNPDRLEVGCMLEWKDIKY